MSNAESGSYIVETGVFVSASIENTAYTVLPKKASLSRRAILNIGKGVR